MSLLGFLHLFVFFIKNTVFVIYLTGIALYAMWYLISYFRLHLLLRRGHRASAVLEDQITSVCRAAYKYKAATAAHRATDTIKIADSKGFIESTPDRSTVWLAQTPQVFKTKLYRAAAYTAFTKGVEATDDNSLVEYVKHPVRLIECGSHNIKVTTREDICLAEAILRDRKQEETV